MNVLLFEWLTGGGHCSNNDAADFNEPMLAMGSAMVSAVAADLTEHFDVDLVWNQRLPVPDFGEDYPQSKPQAVLRFHKVGGRVEAQETLVQLAEQADAILVIAPETDGQLTQLIASLGHCRYKLISPSMDFARLTMDKNAFAEETKASGFAHLPCGLLLSSFLEEAANEFPFSFPLVVKPVEGAGSERVTFVENRCQLLGLLAELRQSNELEDFRVEQFVQGDAVSVSVIGNAKCFSNVEFLANNEFDSNQNAGSEASLVLKPLRQKFDREPFGEYRESVDDLSDDQTARAGNLVQRLMPHLPATAGYFGVDMVLSVDGPDFDKVIEVNPRLTMSYLALRKIHSCNLAFEMFARANIR